MKGKISLEEVLWTCGCGTPMGLELTVGGVYDLDCRHCGFVGTLTIRAAEQVRPRRFNNREESPSQTVNQKGEEK